MKKFFLYGSVVIIAILLILIMIAPKSETIQRSIIIEKPIDVVYPYFASLQNIEEYDVLQTLDPNTVHEYRGVGNTVGSVRAWKSEHKRVGVGEQEIIEMIPNKEIISELRIEKPVEFNSTTFFKFDDNGTDTKVIWGQDLYYGALQSVFMMLVDVNKLKGSDLEKGLQNAKSILEE
ncbi:SRPBCC family protein [Wenyingzhuangia marina]|uniref:Polyketide cyclase / dehydrase and lipid transport n=1 Tax=Wenyingzhuangia marina TaxID=1195760 RepID=A0A1M5WNK3_9FLAO|nr:SRPBCC family protein [Wenyingzhuangia marina]SHH89098.1 Polyketide cyclase / dehydrase and lipid transport [Wenyingzhuangia marina]